MPTCDRAIVARGCAAFADRPSGAHLTYWRDLRPVIEEMERWGRRWEKSKTRRPA